MLGLKKHLFHCYGSFADKRIKDLKKSATFIVDDRDASDFNSQSKLYSYFCMIFVHVKSADSVEVDLRGNVPMTKGVEDWIEKAGADYTEGNQSSLTFLIVPGHEHRLEHLADRVEAIVRPGAPRYTVRSYKYVCPRTAGSLRRLAENLREHWSPQKPDRTGRRQ